jgi:serine O-acetyltransferase
MITSLKTENFTSFISHQLNSLFYDYSHYDNLGKLVNDAFDKLEFCFSKINNKYFFDGKDIYFNHLNGDQYSMFLYFLSQEAYKSDENEELASRFYLLNKYLFGIDVFYEVNLPKIFMFVHPVGTVLGRAEYNDYLVVYQRCGVGSSGDKYPILSKYLTLHPGSSILGASKTSENNFLAADSLLLNKELQANSLYIGNPNSYKIRERKLKNNVWVF